MSTVSKSSATPLHQSTGQEPRGAFRWLNILPPWCVFQPAQLPDPHPPCRVSTSSSRNPACTCHSMRQRTQNSVWIFSCEMPQRLALGGAPPQAVWASSPDACAFEAQPVRRLHACARRRGPSSHALALDTQDCGHFVLQDKVRAGGMPAPSLREPKPGVRRLSCVQRQ